MLCWRGEMCRWPVGIIGYAPAICGRRFVKLVFRGRRCRTRSFVESKNRDVPVKVLLKRKNAHLVSVYAEPSSVRTPLVHTWFYDIKPRFYLDNTFDNGDGRAFKTLVSSFRYYLPTEEWLTEVLTKEQSSIFL